MCRFFRCRGKLCPGAGKAVSRRRGKVTFIQYRKKCVGFPGAGGSCVPAPGKLFPGAGERLAGRGLVCFELDDSYIKYCKDIVSQR